MTPLPHDPIDRIRTASRQMVRELGFMQATLAATDHPPSAVHTLIEIGERGTMAASDLSEFLGLEKSSVSRMVRKLVLDGELKETPSRDDARVKLLVLTARGRRTLAAIHRYAREQVSTALAHLSGSQQRQVDEGIALYAEALRARRLGGAVAVRPCTIEQGLRPGLVGRVAEMHAEFYAGHANFGLYFETQVATGMADLAARLGHPRNAVWTALDGERVVGAVAIDGEDLGNNEAHLRFFIVDEQCRGTGAGKNLLAHALGFCDAAGFAATRLWTFRGLDAARALYERHGFRLDSEQTGTQWGAPVIEQCFVRRHETP